MDDKEIRRDARDALITFLGENDKETTAWVTIIEQTDSYIKFRTNGGNLITISYNRLIRIKERGQ